MTVIFSDLDGALLDHHTYSCAAARLALREVKRRGIPLVFCTSKTRSEVEVWRRELRVYAPFIVENGGAIYMSPGYFSFRPRDARRRNGYDVIEFGDEYQDLVKTLELASQESGCRVLGFHSMSADEISIRTRLPLRHAELAMQREYDEPFEILDPGTHRLLGAIEAHGKRWTRGDRFYHITGSNNKATAVRRLIELYREAFGEVETVGLGSAWNDLEFLKSVDVPILVRSEVADSLKKLLPRIEVTESPGAVGWSQAVTAALEGAPGCAQRSAS
jgi:mannosyl-3-phosphoglycerate phosphatase